MGKIEDTIPLLTSEELKKQSGEELIGALVSLNYIVGSYGGKYWDGLEDYEYRLIEEISERFNLDEEKLGEELS